MKCPKCGYLGSQFDQQCRRCGMPFVPPEPPQRKPREQGEGWRSEVSQKVKAYGERKKILTTPPKPLKDEAPEEIEPPTIRKPEPEVRQSAPVRAAANVRSNAEPAVQQPAPPPAPKPNFAETIRSSAPVMP